MEAALKVRVYVGPSLPLHEARPILNADYRPPLRAADLPIACAAGVDVVVILDGAFIQATTASVSQIALCLERGMRVYGAASAGALRAVECKRLGMIGVGEIYRLFESGFEDEDELAVTFDPETGRCLSWPMVNVRNACRRAFEDQIISRDDADRIEAVAKSIYFAERTAASVTKSCSAELDSNTLSRFQSYVRTNADKLDLKAADSRACLSTVAAFVNSRQLPVAPADTGWRPTCGPDVSGVLRELVHTGDEPRQRACGCCQGTCGRRGLPPKARPGVR